LGFWAPASDADPAEADRRVFYRTAEKGVTHKDAGRTDTKLTPHIASWTLKKDDGTEAGKDRHVHQRQVDNGESSTDEPDDAAETE